jgi:hypothetical protein
MSTSKILPAVSSDPRTAQVQAFIAALRKGMKNIGMYRHMPERFPDFLAPALQSLDAALAGAPLTLRVSADSFLVGDEPVWATEGGDNLPGRFFREGVRLLVIAPGIDEQELTQLVLIMLSNPEQHGGEDLVSQLFDAGFAHVKYAVVQGFAAAGISEDDFERAVGGLLRTLLDTAHGFATEELAAQADAVTAQLEAAAADLPAAPALDGAQVDAGFRADVQEELQQKDAARLDSQLAALLINLLQGGQVQDQARVVALLTQSIDGALGRGELAIVASLLNTLAAYARPGTVAAEVRAALAAALSEAPRLKALGEQAAAAGGPGLAAIARYLGELRNEALPGLLQLLGGLEPGDVRTLVLETAAILGRGDPRRLTPALGSAQPREVKDALAVLERIGGPTLVTHLEQALHVPTATTRIEALAALVAAKLPDGYRLATRAIRDRDEAVRAAALRAAAKLGGPRAGRDLLALTKADDFDKRPEAERQVLYECLGQTEAPEVAQELGAVLAQPKKMLFSGKQVEAKLLAVHALAHMPTQAAATLLQTAIEAKTTEPDVATAARQALAELKHTLAGGRRRPEAGGAAPAARPSEEVAQALAVLQRTLVAPHEGGER